MAALAVLCSESVVSDDKKISSQSPGTGTRQPPGLWWADCACPVVSGQLESETVTSVAPRPIRPPLQVSPSEMPSVIQIVIIMSSCHCGVFTPAQMTASSDPDQDSELAQRGEAYLVVM